MMQVELLKGPTDNDWLWVKQCAINTAGFKTVVNEPDSEWKARLIKSEHSPIRELWFGFLLDIPYWVSVHLVRHHIGVNHYIQSQRDDRTKNDIPRAEKPQGEIVSHIMSVNAQELINLAHKRLCRQSSPETRQAVQEICKIVIKNYPEFEGMLVPQCVYRNGQCNEMFPCGRYAAENEKQKAMIADIEKMIRKKYTGKTYEEAQRFIDDNMSIYISNLMPC